MSFTPLTPDTQRLIAQDFSPEDQLAAAELLEQKCGTSLPLMGDRLPEEIERVRFAVLKLCHGNIEQLAREIDIANCDWRDTLVGAGFGHSVLAHRTWFSEHTGG